MLLSVLTASEEVLKPLGQDEFTYEIFHSVLMASTELKKVMLPDGARWLWGGGELPP